ncbi:hypothetical protein ACFE04_000030 [Oxalis oulophora]
MALYFIRVGTNFNTEIWVAAFANLYLREAKAPSASSSKEAFPSSVRLEKGCGRRLSKPLSQMAFRFITSDEASGSPNESLQALARGNYYRVILGKPHLQTKKFNMKNYFIKFNSKITFLEFATSYHTLASANTTAPASRMWLIDVSSLTTLAALQQFPRTVSCKMRKVWEFALHMRVAGCWLHWQIDEITVLSHTNWSTPLGDRSPYEFPSLWNGNLKKNNKKLTNSPPPTACPANLIHLLETLSSDNVSDWPFFRFPLSFAQQNWPLPIEVYHRSRLFIIYFTAPYRLPRQPNPPAGDTVFR